MRLRKISLRLFCAFLSIHMMLPMGNHAAALNNGGQPPLGVSFLLPQVSEADLTAGNGSMSLAPSTDGGEGGLSLGRESGGGLLQASPADSSQNTDGNGLYAAPENTVTFDQYGFSLQPDNGSDNGAGSVALQPETGAAYQNEGAGPSLSPEIASGAGSALVPDAPESASSLPPEAEEDDGQSALSPEGAEAEGEGQEALGMDLGISPMSIVTGGGLAAHEAIVDTYADLKAVLEANNGISTVYLAADVAAPIGTGGRISVNHAKSTLVICGDDPRTSTLESYTLENLNTNELYRIYPDYDNVDFTFENITLVTSPNNLDHGALLTRTYKGFTITLNNVKARGGTILKSMYGKLILQDVQSETVASSTGYWAGYISIRGNCHFEHGVVGGNAANTSSLFKLTRNIVTPVTEVPLETYHNANVTINLNEGYLSNPPNATGGIVADTGFKWATLSGATLRVTSPKELSANPISYTPAVNQYQNFYVADGAKVYVTQTGPGNGTATVNCGSHTYIQGEVYLERLAGTGPVLRTSGLESVGDGLVEIHHRGTPSTYGVVHITSSMFCALNGGSLRVFNDGGGSAPLVYVAVAAAINMNDPSEIQLYTAGSGKLFDFIAPNSKVNFNIGALNLWHYNAVPNPAKTDMPTHIVSGNNAANPVANAQVTLTYDAAENMSATPVIAANSVINHDQYYSGGVSHATRWNLSTMRMMTGGRVKMADAESDGDTVKVTTAEAGNAIEATYPYSWTSAGLAPLTNATTAPAAAGPTTISLSPKLNGNELLRLMVREKNWTGMGLVNYVVNSPSFVYVEPNMHFGTLSPAVATALYDRFSPANFRVEVSKPSSTQTWHLRLQADHHLRQQGGMGTPDELTNALKFRELSTDPLLTVPVGSEISIFSGTSSAWTDRSWGPGTGLLLEVPPGKGMAGYTYACSLVWTLYDTP